MMLRRSRTCLLFALVSLSASLALAQQSQSVLNMSPMEISGQFLSQSEMSHQKMPTAVSGDCESSFDSELQTVTVKKSVLGCLEEIEVKPQDEIWLINARACLCGETDLCLLRTCRLVSGCRNLEDDYSPATRDTESQFETSSLEELTALHASRDDKTTVLYVHGNQTNLEFAIARGMQVYRNAFASKADCRAPIRFVIWAWKSEQEMTRLYPDYLIKSKRSVVAGETFAATLNRFSDRNLVLFGYSLGVQVVLSALDSTIKDLRHGDPTRYQVAFVAPAINADYVASNSLAVEGDSPAERTFVFFNRKDRAIRAAQAIIRRKAPSEEATISGLSNAGKLDLGPVTTFEISNEAGRFHSIERYTRSETMQLKFTELVNRVSVLRQDFTDLPATPTLAVEPALTIEPTLGDEPSLVVETAVDPKSSKP